MIIGLHPEEVLDMTYEVLLICADAYATAQKARYENEINIAVINAYYSGYYATPSKRRKVSPDKVFRKIVGKSVDKEVDPELVYRRQEEKFKNGN